jgi:hypothetical protein
VQHPSQRLGRAVPADRGVGLAADFGRGLPQRAGAGARMRDAANRFTVGAGCSVRARHIWVDKVLTRARRLGAVPD